jgi:ATP-binding cassette subfamily B protein
MPLDKFVEIWTGVLVLMIPNDGFNAKNEKVSNLSRFIYLLHQTKISLHRHYLGQ